VIAWLYGFRTGLIAGLLCFPFNACMLTVFGINWVNNMIMTGGGFAGGISLILIAIIVGRLSDLSRRLSEELIVRQAIEQELLLHRENLEKLVTDKVKDLQESRERFRAIAENSPDAIIITDAPGVNIYCNHGAELMFGYAQDEIVGHNSIMFLPPEMREGELSRRASLMQSGKHVAITATIESDMVRKDGEKFPVEFSLYSWSLGGESFYSMIIRDITQRRQAESSVKVAAEALQRSRDFFQNVFDVAGDGLYVTDNMGNIVFANRALNTMLGYEPGELIGMSGTAFSVFMDTVSVGSNEEQHWYTRDYTTPMETVYCCKDGTHLPVETRLNHISADGVIGGGIVVMLRDITDRKRAESSLRAATEALQRSRDFFLNVFNAAGDGIYVTDDTGNIVFANKALCAMLGYEPGELIGIPAVGAFTVEDDAPDASRLMSLDYTEPFTTVHRCKDGSILDVECRLTNVQEEGQPRAGIIAVLRDITERKQAQEQLRQARDSLATMFRASPDAIIVADASGYITAANDSVYDVYGHSPEALIGQHVSMLPDNEDSMRQNIALVEQLYEQSIVRGFETTRKHKDGRSIQVETSVALFRNPDGTPAGAISSTRDITERKQLEAQLQRSRDYLEKIFMASPDAIVVADDQGYIIMANDSVYDVYGYSHEELIGQHGSIFTPRDQRILQQTMKVLEQLYEQGFVRNVVNERLLKDGRTIWTESNYVLLRNQDGTINGSVSSTRDITERIRLEDQLRQSQKMEAIGTLAGGIAHDFNNILGAIIGYTELSQHESICDPRIKNNLEQVLKAADRARNLVRQILAFSRKTQSEFKPLQVNVILKEALKLMRASIAANIAIETDITDTGDVVLADATQIHQIIVNLCTNAAHAMEPEGGVMKITLKPFVLQSADMIAYSDLQPGPYLQLSIRDTGLGVEPENIGRIFEPFFTTKDVGKGTGMGLAVVHGIVKSLKGDIKVYSEPGRGTVFHVLLPRMEDVSAISTAVEIEPPRGNGSVLLVDDEPALMDVGANILRSLGYDVTAMQSPLDAFEKFAGDPSAFDLVFTDQSMPGLSGFDLARRVLALRPGIPVILCTGYSDLVTEETAMAAGIKAFVTKPLRRVEIAETIRTVIGVTKPV
jgi:PAS domain S-box-containing protein